MGIKSKIYNLSDIEFIDLVQSCYTYSDILRAIGLTTSGSGSRDSLKRRINELNIDISHFNSTINNQGNKEKYSLNDILVENSTYTSRTTLKNRIITENKLEYICAKCNNKGKWLDEKLSLQLHHKNGIYNDHRLENLEFLCPNCHSITDNYAGKNK